MLATESPQKTKTKHVKLDFVAFQKELPSPPYLKKWENETRRTEQCNFIANVLVVSQRMHYQYKLDPTVATFWWDMDGYGCDMELQ